MRDHNNPVRVLGGICMGVCGLERAARTGRDQIHVQAQTNPVHCPDCRGLPAQILCWPRPGLLSGRPHSKHNKGPVIIYDWGGGTFCRKYFRGPLHPRQKKIAAYSRSRQKFSMPTLIGRNKYVLL